VPPAAFVLTNEYSVRIEAAGRKPASWIHGQSGCCRAESAPGPFAARSGPVPCAFTHHPIASSASTKPTRMAGVLTLFKGPGPRCRKKKFAKH